MKTPILAFAVFAAIASMSGCGSPTTGADIDRIMAEARDDAAKDLDHARSQSGGSAAAGLTQAADYSSPGTQ